MIAECAFEVTGVVVPDSCVGPARSNVRRRSWYQTRQHQQLNSDRMSLESPTPAQRGNPGNSADHLLRNGLHAQALEDSMNRP